MMRGRQQGLPPRSREHRRRLSANAHDVNPAFGKPVTVPGKRHVASVPQPIIR